MHILVLGATGPTGIQLVHHLLKTIPTCTISLYVRSPQKVPPEFTSNPRITIITGQLTDSDALASAMKDTEIVISTLGPSVQKGPFHPANTPIAKGYEVVVQTMKQQQVKRLICLGTASIPDPNDKFNLAFKILVNGVKTLARNAYNDVVAIGKVVREEAGAGLDWTIVRIPVLTDKENTKFIAGYVGDGHTGTFLTRNAFAEFVVGEVQQPQWVHKAPLISDA